MQRHFELNELIELHYKNRDTSPDALDKCIKYCLEDISNIHAFTKAWADEEQKIGRVPIKLPRIPAFERLAIIYEKLGNFEAAIDICHQAIKLGLNNSDKCYSPSDFSKRISKLEKKWVEAGGKAPKETTFSKNIVQHNKLQEPYPIEENGIPIIWLTGEKLASQAGKAQYRSFNGQGITIEELVLDHYSRQGFKGLNSENEYWWSIMGLLFWDVIFAKLPGVFSPDFGEFPSRLQDMPQDLFTSDFYSRRQALINKRISEISESHLLGIQRPNLEKIIRNAFSHHHSKPCRVINWDAFVEDELVLATKILTTDQLIRIMQRLLINFVDNRRGLPDLFLIKNDKPLFVEVKSEKEKVAEHQYEWMHYLKNHVGIDVQICRVRNSRII